MAEQVEPCNRANFTDLSFRLLHTTLSQIVKATGDRNTNHARRKRLCNRYDCDVIDIPIVLIARFGYPSAKVGKIL